MALDSLWKQYDIDDEGFLSYEKCAQMVQVLLDKSRLKDL